MAKTTTCSSHFEQREKGTSTEKDKILLAKNILEVITETQRNNNTTRRQKRTHTYMRPLEGQALEQGPRPKDQSRSADTEAAKIIFLAHTKNFYNKAEVVCARPLGRRTTKIQGFAVLSQSAYINFADIYLYNTSEAQK